MPAPSTLYTQRDILNYTAFAIASAAVSSRPNDPAPTVVLEYPVRVDICAAATTICPAEACESPLRN